MWLSSRAFASVYEVLSSALSPPAPRVGVGDEARDVPVTNNKGSEKESAQTAQTLTSWEDKWIGN